MKRELLIEGGDFYRDEFECPGENCCGHSAPVSRDLIIALQILRNMLGAPLIISSGFRCKTHNARTPGAAPDSYHCKSEGADAFRPAHFTMAEFFGFAKRVPHFRDGGIGTYENRLHLDVRSNGPARWEG